MLCDWDLNPRYLVPETVLWIINSFTLKTCCHLFSFTYKLINKLNYDTSAFSMISATISKSIQHFCVCHLCPQMFISISLTRVQHLNFTLKYQVYFFLKQVLTFSQIFCELIYFSNIKQQCITKEFLWKKSYPNPFNSSSQATLLTLNFQLSGFLFVSCFILSIKFY